MKYKEFIQKFESVTDGNTSLSGGAYQWAVKDTDDSIKVYNKVDGQPLLTISKKVYGSMHVYQLPDPSAIAIYRDATLLNKTPKVDRVEANPDDTLKDEKDFLSNVVSQLLNWTESVPDLAKGETRTFYFVGFSLRVSNNALTIDGPHLQGSVSSDRNPNKNFEDNLYDLIYSCQGFQKELLEHEDIINSAVDLLKAQKEDDTLMQFNINHTTINSKYLTMCDLHDCLFTWYFEPAKTCLNWSTWFSKF